MDTLALDIALWDLDVDAKGNWRTVGDATPQTRDTGPGMRLAQDVATRCMAWRGEVYYDTTQGVRFETILGQAPNMSVVANAFQSEALQVPGCATALPKLSFDTKTRKLTGDLTVAYVSGVQGGIAFAPTPAPQPIAPAFSQRVVSAAPAPIAQGFGDATTLGSARGAPPLPAVAGFGTPASTSDRTGRLATVDAGFGAIVSAPAAAPGSPVSSPPPAPVPVPPPPPPPPPPPAGDPLYGETVLLLTTGANGADAIIDGSSAARGSLSVTTPFPVWDSSWTKFGLNSLKFDGSSNYLFATEITAGEYAKIDFSIEFWIKPSVVNTTQILIVKQNGTGYSPFEIYIDNSGFSHAWSFKSGLVHTNVSSLAPHVVDTEYFLKYERQGSNLSYYIDDVLQGTEVLGIGEDLIDIPGSSTYIGATGSGGLGYDGGILGLRITNNTIRPAGLPTAAFDDFGPSIWSAWFSLPMVWTADFRQVTSATGPDRGISRSFKGRNSGKFYFEIQSDINNILGAQPDLMAGVADLSMSRAGFPYYDAPAGINAWYQFNGYSGNQSGRNATQHSAVPTLGVVGVAVDLTAQTVDFYVNNVLQVQETYTAGPPTMYPAVWLDGAVSGAYLKINASDADFIYAPPAGFFAWDT